MANWSWNPINDLLFARVTGPLLYGNHALVGLFLCFNIIYLTIWRKRNISISLVLLLATVSIHEFILLPFSTLWWGWSASSALLSTTYSFWLIAFLALALHYGTKHDRKLLGQIALICCAYFAVMDFVFFLQNFHPITLAKFSYGPDVFNPEANAVELLSWFIPFSWWTIKGK